jgi:hypothetical protein
VGSSWVEAELGRRLARDEAVTVAFYDVEGFRSFDAARCWLVVMAPGGATSDG